MVPSNDSPSFRRGRPTIAFIVTWGYSNPYSSPMWWGAVEAAEELDVNLVGFGDIAVYERNQERSLYAMISAGVFDGLIILNATSTEIRDIFPDLPFVNISSRISDAVTSITVDNRVGTNAVMEHLIKEHAARRIAFFLGPDNNIDAAVRYQAYRDTLDRHGLPIGPDLEFIPPNNDWSIPVGREGVQALLARGVHFDAIVTANDNMALGAVAELQNHGLQVPYDVLVAGFDDEEEAQTCTPPLTTVRQPLKLMGETALRVLVAKLRGEDVEREVVFPAELVIRRSCGCFSKAVVQVDPEPGIKRPCETRYADRDASPEELLELRRQALDAKTDAKKAELSQMDGLLKSLAADIGGAKTNELLASVDLLARQMMERQAAVADLQDVLSELRREGMCILEGKPNALAHAENLWHRARVLLNDMVMQEQIKEQQLLVRQTAVLHDISRRLSVTFLLPGLMDILVEDLGQLEIRSCYAGLYETGKETFSDARLWLAYSRNARIPLPEGGRRYPIRELLPEDSWGKERVTLALTALDFQHEEMGFALFEVGPKDGTIYEALRNQLSSSIKGALLFEERNRLLAKLESLSQTDELTGHLNRRGFLSAAERQLIHCRRYREEFGLFFLDLDGLKKINDTYGHDDGDLAIRTLGEILRSAFRAGDIIARIGGDEFTVMAIACDEEKFANVQERLDSFAVQANRDLGKPWLLSASVGMFFSGADCAFSLEEMMEHADKDLYRVKRAKKGLPPLP